MEKKRNKNKLLQIYTPALIYPNPHSLHLYFHCTLAIYVYAIKELSIYLFILSNQLKRNDNNKYNLINSCTG